MTDSVTVLLVERDEGDYLLTTEILKRVVGTDYRILRCEGFRSARAHLEEHGGDRIDVCIIDFRLNRFSGLDVLRYMATRPEQTPCVMLNGAPDPELDREAMAEGAVAYLVKGQFDSESIERTLRYAIENSKIIKSLRESEGRFRSVVESATDGIVLLDADAVLLASNGAANDLLGASAKNLIGRPCFDFLTEHSTAAVLDQLKAGRTESSMVTGLKPFEAHVIHATGKLVPVELTINSWISAANRYWSIILRDVTERKARSEKLTHQAFHDPLTGLANRTLLRGKVTDRFRTIGYVPGIPALIFLDLDDFKLVNDTFGHEAGDELLTVVAARLVGCVRDDDLVARLGGDEFAVFLDACQSAATAEAVAKRLVASLAEPVIVAGHPLRASGSAGVALASSSGMTPEDLLRNADVAMYSAKSSGKNRLAVFEEKMHDASVERTRMEHDLRAALDAEGIQVAYQPIVDLADNSVQGFEALARWTDPDRGVVPPDVFISVAENAGLIEQLGRSVLKRAVQDTATLQASHGFPYQVSVNLSTRQLEDPELISYTRALLEESGLIPGSLTLEVTESVMVGHVDRAIGVLNELRDLQVKLALDDFGTGYSSLSYLPVLPLDSLKADRSFVARHAEPLGAAVLRGVVAIGRSLGLHTVAEGIEDENERAAVAALGFNLGQGYLFSKPISVSELGEFLEAANLTR